MVSIGACLVGAVLFWPDESGGVDSDGPAPLGSAPAISAAIAIATPSAIASNSRVPARAGIASALGGPSGSIRGRVLSADGTELRRTVTVQARMLVAKGADLESLPRYAWGPVPTLLGNPKFPTIDVETDARGCFRFLGLAPGPWKLATLGVGIRKTDGPVVIVGEGEEPNPLFRCASLPEELATSICVSLGFPGSVPARESIHVVTAAGTSLLPELVFADERWFARFEDVPAGGVSLVIDDPRYQVWRRDGITASGQRIEAELRWRWPVAPLSVTARDAWSGERLTPRSISVCDMAGLFLLGPLEPKNRGAADFVGIPTCALRLSVFIDGYLGSEIDVPAAAAGAPRVVEAELRPLPSVAGVVLGAGGRDGERDVEVRLFKPKNLDDTNENGSWIVNTWTDPRGRFALRLPLGEPGNYAVEADWGCGVRAISDPLELGPLARVQGLTLRKPPCGSIRGRLRAASGDFGGMLVFAESASGAWKGARLARVAADGAFCLDSIQPGPARLYAQLPSPMAAADDSNWLPPTIYGADHGLALDLGDLLLRAGESRVDFDLGTQLSTFLDLTVLVNGRPEPWLLVKGVRSDRVGRVRSLASTDANGFARVGPLPPGRIYVEVAAADGSWIWRIPTPLDAEDGVARALTIDVPIHEEELWLSDVEGNPARWKPLVVYHASAGESDHVSQVCVSDGSGALTLRLPPGKIHVARLVSGAGWVESPWGAETGRVSLKLAK